MVFCDDCGQQWHEGGCPHCKSGHKETKVEPEQPKKKDKYRFR